MRKYFPLNDGAVSHVSQLLLSEFPYTVYEENFILFFISACTESLVVVAPATLKRKGI